MSNNSINDNKTFSQFAEAITRKIAIAMNCMKIGEIVSFDKNDQTATIKVLHRWDNNYNTDLTETVDYPLLQKVPVTILQGGGSRITFPIKSGDQCIILFCDYMIDNWWISGSVGASDFPRKHDLSDAIAIVGLQALPKAIQGYSDYLHLQYNEKSSIVVGNTIKLDNAIVETTGNVDVGGVVTAKSVQPADGYSGVVYTGTQVLTFANGILVSIQP